MHHRARDITGLTVGYLTALKYHGSDGRKSLWLVQCVCGVEKLLPAADLQKMQQRGITASCGCMKNATISAKRTTHGMSKHPAFAVWRSMLDRCRLPSHQAWENYGGRGVTVCETWSAAFENFWQDMGPTYRKGLTLERRENSQGYSPANCYWATYKEQANNTRQNRRVGGVTAAQLAESLGVKRSTMYYRLAQGVPVDRLGEPPDVSRKFMTSSTVVPEADS